MKKISLVQRFSLITLAAMVVFAFAFGKILDNTMKHHMINRAINDTADIVFNNVVKHFQKEDLLTVKTGMDYDVFTDEITHLTLGPDIETLEIWNKDMIVVWSSDKDDVGKKFPDREKLKMALEGKLLFELTTGSKEGKEIFHDDIPQGVHVNNEKLHSHGDHDNKSSEETRRLLELYIPIYFNDGEISTVIEIYQNVEQLYQNIENHNRIIWITTMISFAVLYVLLFGIMWNASKRIEKQNREIKQSKQDWEGTFNSISDMITVHDRNFNIIQSNSAAKELLGLPVLDGSSKCFKYFHGTETAPPECSGSQCLQSGSPCTTECFEPHLNKNIELRAIPRIGEDGNKDGLIHIIRDISDRKRDEAMIQKQLNRLSALRSIDSAIIGSMDRNIILEILLDQVMNHLDIDAASVLLFNKHSQSLEYTASKGFRSTALRYTKLRLGESNAGRAAIERRLVAIPNLQHHAGGFSNSTHFEKEDFITYFAIPLIAKGEVKGVLELFHRSYKNIDDDWSEFLESITALGAIALDNSLLFDELQRSNTELTLAYDTTIEGWSRALDLRDKETEGHTQRVSELTVHISRVLEIKEETIVHYRRGALLHDIGKMGIPDSILLKPGPLTDEEWDIMRMHPVYAHQMLYPVEYLRPAIEIPYFHHEKWDGTGYPKGLKGEEIPISARIFAIIDVWDALRSDRPYRPAWSKEKVFEHVLSLSGTHFDPEVVKVFMKGIEVLEESVVMFSR